MNPQTLLDELHAIFQDAEPVELIPGTMDTDKLFAGFEKIRAGLSDEDIDAIVSVMNEETLFLDE